MRRVKKWRYYCEFCKKSGNSGSHMARHEARCTMNPHRECRVCGMIRDDGVYENTGKVEPGHPDMAALVALLPNVDEFREPVDEPRFLDDGIVDVANKALPALREATNNCPACIMAAIRQAKIPVPMVTGFNFSEEMKSIWADVNQKNYS